jgi:hypothetical protein
MAAIAAVVVARRVTLTSVELDGTLKRIGARA